MVNWQVTATTIHCDAVDDEVTLMVYKDRSTKCTGYKRYGEPGKEIFDLLKSKSKQLKRHLECEGPECLRAIQYRDKLFAEEAGRVYLEQTNSEMSMPHQREGGHQG